MAPVRSSTAGKASTRTRSELNKEGASEDLDWADEVSIAESCGSGGGKRPKFALASDEKTTPVKKTDIMNFFAQAASATASTQSGSASGARICTVRGSRQIK